MKTGNSKRPAVNTRPFRTRKAPSARPESFPIVLGFLAALLPDFCVRNAFAEAAGMSVQSGSVNVSSTGPILNISASHNSRINWTSFNLAPGEGIRFIQPSPSSIVWNHVQDPNPSQIHGSIEANGIVALINQAGFYFGPGAFVNAAGVIVSTAAPQLFDQGAGLFWQFSGAPPRASIVNHGTIHAGGAGSLFLISEHIENHGTLSAPQGEVGLLAGREVLLSSRPDGLGLSASIQLPQGSIDNTGRIVADAGTIAMNARVVNQNGLLQANTVLEKNGVIELVSSESISLGDQSSISARGPVGSSEDGGLVRIKSAGSFADSRTSQLQVGGGTTGGDGGRVEISAPFMDSIKSSFDGSPGIGGRGGELLIDPADIVLGTTGTGGAPEGSIVHSDPPAGGVLSLDVNSAFTGFSRITLQATRNISLVSGTLWDLGASTGLNEPGSLLQLEAGNNITIASGASIIAPENWSISLQAGRNFSGPPESVVPGTGNIALTGNASLQSHNGDIDLLAGNNITVAGGHVRTIGGGNIHANALSGNINTGTKAVGFRFLPTGYSPDIDLGGISTAAGGSVTLAAGLDVTSLLPVAGGVLSDPGSGAFGQEPGDVTVKAGRDISGHFVVRNGKGSIEAGRNAGTASRLLALSLVNGGWSVRATDDILLQEVRNPNGLFNNLGSSGAANRHRFDYSADAYTRLAAGNSIQLRGTALPRFNDAFSQGIPPIYPGTLSIEAGAGGFTLGNDVVLFPSPTGNLTVNVLAGGSMTGTIPGDLAQLILSDSGKRQYREFGDFGVADHAAIPVHLGDTTPVSIRVSGNLSGVLIGSAKRAEIEVGGDMINSRFEGQNLHSTDITRLEVAGDIINRNEFTSVPLAVPPDFSAFEQGLIHPAPAGSLVGLENRFAYDSSLKTLTFQGRMTGDELQLLLNTPVRLFDPNGAPVIEPNGEPATRTIQTLDPALAGLLYDLSQDVPQNPDTGYRLGGAGFFNIRASNLDLGATAGIVSQGPRANPSLARYFDRGADIDVALSGNLDMFSTRIASLNGGGIQVRADGSINVGSSTFKSSDSAARGIYTVDASDVSVQARGDININGSRIAAYDGGNVSVRSLAGSVDAGTGGSGSATVEKIQVDPLTREIRSYAPTIPGSGVLATTFPPSLDPAFPASQSKVGNILMETPRGNIVASSGGVVQIPLNGAGSTLGTVSLKAGTRDEAGNVVHLGNIDASGSGVIGSTVRLEASGDIKGLVFARGNIDLDARQSVNVTALAQGNVNVGAGATVSGTIIGVGSVTASAASVDAALLSQNISASGNVTSSQVGFSQGTAAAATSQSLQKEDSTKSIVNAKSDPDEEESRRQRSSPAPKLTRTVGRVTVILPATK